VAYRYRAFGEQTVVSGSSPNRFTWVGRSGYYQQPDSADYWIRARVYRPTIGRWVSREPVSALRLALSTARNEAAYCYAGNASTLLADPSGLILEQPRFNYFSQWHDTTLWMCRCRESKGTMAYAAEFWPKLWKKTHCNCRCLYCKVERGKSRRWKEPGFCTTVRPAPPLPLPELPKWCKKMVDALDKGKPWSQLDCEDCCDWIADTLGLKRVPKKSFMEACYTSCDLIPLFLKNLLGYTEQG